MVNIFHSDLRNRKIQKAVAEVLSNIKSGRREIRLRIYKLSRLIYIYWLLLCCAVMCTYLVAINLYYYENSLEYFFPLQLLFKKDSIAQKFVFIIVSFFMAAALVYPLMFPGTFGIYIGFHIWSQFALLNNYLKIHFWTKSEKGEPSSYQRDVCKKIQKVVKGHQHIKR